MQAVGSPTAGVPTIHSRLSRRTLFTAIASGLGVAALSSCQIGAATSFSPINPANRPTTILGYRDGYLPTSILYSYSSKCLLYRPAAGSFATMLDAAHQDGVELQPLQGYRDYADQVAMRQYWCSVGQCDDAATPGYSNHGWGKAADFVDQDGSLTWTSIGYRWLVANAGTYGWNHPGGVDEAWHWEWVGDGGTMDGYPVLPNLMEWAPLPGG